MHFGRVSTLSDTDWSLPADPDRTVRFLDLPLHGQQKVYLGCPVWGDKAWVGRLYPPGTKAANFLEVYGQHFNTVELNSSFYHIPTPEQMQRWVKQVQPEFRFSPKVHRKVSEQLGTPLWRQPLLEFCKSAEHLGDKLGRAFMQLPEWFGSNRFPQLVEFFQHWPQAMPLAVEFRHRSWFVNHRLQDEAVNLLYRHKASAVITDTLGCRYALHLSLTWPSVVIRFLGSNGHASDVVRLQEWAKRLKYWQNKGLDEIYFFAHQAQHELIPETANILKGFLESQSHDFLIAESLDQLL